MQAQLNAAISMINGYLWDYLIIFILIGAGLYFTFTTKFVQIRYLGEMIRLITSSAGEKTEKNHISSFQAFCVTTASRVGVGNIAGIAIAVVIGGPGAIFWMWVIALLGASTGFVECTLAQIYKNLYLMVVSMVALHTTSNKVLTALLSPFHLQSLLQLHSVGFTTPYKLIH